MRQTIGVTVGEIMNMDLLKDAQVLGGDGGLSNYVVAVNVMEVPDIVNWVRPGEFLLTTAYSIKDDIQRLNELIPVLKEIGVAGIGIKVKRYVDTLPQSVLTTADSLDFPIVSVPLDVSFGDVITLVLTTVVNRQTNLLIQIDDFNNRLKEIMLRGGDLLQIAEMIHDAVDAPVAITEEVFKELVIISGELPEMGLRTLLEKESRRHSERSRTATGEWQIKKCLDPIGEGDVLRLMIPICSDDMYYGDVMIWDVQKTVTESMLIMIQAATSLIALNSAKKLSVYENENKHKIEFIEGILSENESDQVKAIEKTNYFDFNLQGMYGVIVASLSNTSRGVRYTPNNSRMLKQLSGKLITVVERLHRSYSGELIFGNKSDRVIFLLGFDRKIGEAEAKKRMMAFTDDIYSFAKLENIHDEIHTGVGRVYSDYRALSKSYQEAQRVLQSLSLHHDGSQVLHFDDLGIYRILSHEAIQSELHQFFMEILGPIAAYDREKDAELIRTLKMYYSCDCNLKRVSQEMYTHYNTVIYRMQRIRDIGNIDLNDANTALNVHIALKILDVISPEVL